MNYSTRCNCLNYNPATVVRHRVQYWIEVFFSEIVLILGLLLNGKYFAIE